MRVSRSAMARSRRSSVRLWSAAFKHLSSAPRIARNQPVIFGGTARSRGPSEVRPRYVFLTIHLKPCDLRVGSARAGCPRRATRPTDRSRGSCPRVDNAAECQPDRARMLPSELPNPACAGVPQVQCRRGPGPVSGHRRESFREAVSGRQTVRLFSAESSTIPEFLSLRCESASSTFPQYRACDCNTLAAPGCPLRTSARTCRGRAQGLFQR